MDPQALLELFAGTLDGNVQTRSGAEATLAQADTQPQFLQGCLSIILEPQIQPGIKKAASVYMKNKVHRAWAPERASRLNLAPLAEVEKAGFRERIVPALTDVPTMIRPILLPVVSSIVKYDYPSHWPELLPTIHNLLTASDANAVYSGLSLFLQVCRYYRWGSNSNLKNLDPVLEAMYPAVLSIGERLVDEEGLLVDQMLYDIMKIYKMASMRSLPPLLQNPEIAQRTVALFLHTVVRKVPESLSQLDSLDREQHPWSKAKKWASFNILRTQTAYLSSRNNLSSRAAQYASFRKHYLATYTPEIINVFLKQLQYWSTKEVWIPNATLYNIVSYIGAVVDHKPAWEQIEPHAQGLMEHIIYPLLCPTEEELELFEDDPVEYVHKSVDFYAESPTVDVAASNFLSMVVRKRKKTFLPIVEFLQTTVSAPRAQQNTLDGAVAKIGALRIMQTLAPVVLTKNNPIKDQVEYFLNEYVVPDLASPFGILRTRACQLINAFASIEFQNRESLQRLYQSVLHCLHDQTLPVQIEAALTLQSLLEHEDIQAALSAHVTEVMQILLALTKRIDLDQLMTVMDEFVNAYPEQISPFAVQMAAQLRNQFLALAAELNDAQQAGADDIELSSATDDKITAGTGILTTLGGLLLSLDHHPELIAQLEQTVIPIFSAVYTNQFEDFYTEALTLHENTLYARKEVTAEQWQLYPTLVQAISGSDLSFMDEAAQVFEAYMQYGSEYLARSRDHLQLLVQLLAAVLDQSNSQFVTVETKEVSFRLGAFLLEIPTMAEGPLKPFIEALLVPTLDTMVVEKDRFSEQKLRQSSLARYAVALVCTVLASIVNDTEQSLAILEAKGLTKPFLMLWFMSVRRFERDGDLKLEELAILALIKNPAAVPSCVVDAFPQLMGILADVIEELPAAIGRRQQAYGGDELDFDEDFDYQDEWNSQDEDEFEEDQSFHVEASAANVSQASQTSQGSGNPPPEFDFSEFHDYDGGDIAYVYSTSPLDDMNPFMVLNLELTTLAQSNPDHYQRLMALLPEAKRASIEAAKLQVQ